MKFTILVFLWGVENPVEYVETVEECTVEVYRQMVDKHRPTSNYKMISGQCEKTSKKEH